MKFKVSMKCPDALYEAVEDAVNTATWEIADEDEREAILEIRKEKLRAQCGKWFEYGEYLVVEIDTEADTCTVLKQ